MKQFHEINMKQFHEFSILLSHLHSAQTNIEFDRSMLIRKSQYQYIPDTIGH